MLRSVDFEDVIKDFALAKSRKRTFWTVYCIAIANVCNRDVNETLACESVSNIDALHSKWCTCNFAVKQKDTTLTCKRDPMVRDRDKTETSDFQSETRSRPRPSHISTRPRRLETTSRDRLETKMSRPRLHPWQLVTTANHYWRFQSHTGLLDMTSAMLINQHTFHCPQHPFLTLITVTVTSNCFCWHYKHEDSVWDLWC